MSSSNSNATLSYMDGEHMRFVRLDRLPFSVGRLPERDLVLTHKCVSRDHAVLLREEDNYFVEDRGSRHGTFVNSEPIQRCLLHDGDTIHIGSMNGPMLRFRNSNSDTNSSGELLKGLGEVTSPKDLGRLSWFLDAARKLNEVGAVEEVLVALVQLTLQLTRVERGFVFMRDKKTGAMRMVLGRNASGVSLQEDETISQRAIQQATDSASKFIVTDTLQDQLASPWMSVVAKNIRSVFCIPLRKRTTETGTAPDEILGLLYLDSRLEPGTLTHVDDQLLEAISKEAAGLIENTILAESERDALAYRQELNVAAQIQQGLMANNLPVLKYATLRAQSVPCKEIGGDFYDVTAMPDCVCITVADISGKGISAAILAASLQGLIYAQMVARQPLADIAFLINRFLCARDVGKYATLILMRLYPDGRIEYLNCGHVQPLVVFEGQVNHLTNANLVVGLLPNATYESAVHQMKHGERIFLVTDGVTEAENGAGDFYGDERLEAAVSSLDLESVLRQVSDFCDGVPANDDCTMLEACYQACL
jgi:phosphoserine phosphatase RsbU/P